MKTGQFIFFSSLLEDARYQYENMLIYAAELYLSFLDFKCMNCNLLWEKYELVQQKSCVATSRMLRAPGSFYSLPCDCV